MYNFDLILKHIHLEIENIFRSNQKLIHNFIDSIRLIIEGVWAKISRSYCCSLISPEHLISYTEENSSKWDKYMISLQRNYYSYPVRSTCGNTYFDFVAGVLEGDTFTPYLSIIHNLAWLRILNVD